MIFRPFSVNIGRVSHTVPISPRPGAQDTHQPFEVSLDFLVDEVWDFRGFPRNRGVDLLELITVVLVLLLLFFSDWPHFFESNATGYAEVRDG